MKQPELKAILVALTCTLISAAAFAVTHEEARKAFDAGDVDDAIRLSKEALETKLPSATEAKFLDVLTRAYIQKQDWTNAYEYCGRLIKWDLRNRQQNVEHRYMTSLILYKLGKTTADSPERNVAVSGVIIALESDPQNKQYQELAEKIGINRPGVNIKVESVAGGTRPAPTPAPARERSEAEVMLENASDAFEKGNDRDAMVFANKAVELDPKMAKAYGMRGAIETMLNDFRGALRDFTMALQLGPMDPAFLYGRARAKSELGMGPAAMSDISQAIKLDDGNFLYYELRALLRDQAGDLQGALDDFTMEVKLNPEYFGSWFNRAIHYLKMKEFGMALVDATAALNIEPKNANVNGLMGECHLALGNREKAIEWYRKAVDLGDESSKRMLDRLLQEQK